MQSSALAFVESVKSGEGVETFGASGRSKTDVSSEIRLDVLRHCESVDRSGGGYLVVLEV
eukprot:753362-Rhodomonas_salina.1